MVEITIWDVQHGSAAHIKTPNNKHLVVDLGDTDNFSPLWTLRAAGVQQLDAVVITHPHRDHMDDIANFRLLAPKVLVTPRNISEVDIRKGNRPQDDAVVSAYLAILREYNQLVPATYDVTSPANFGGAVIQPFFPRNSSTNLNDRSGVLVVSFANLKMIIPGDNESPSWKELLLDPGFVSAIKGADVLLASHHGRDAGYCVELFEAMGKPRLVVVSDGRFGDTSATDRYSKQAMGWTVYDAAGASDTRKCLTTRCDGNIKIKFGWSVNDPQHTNFLNVTTGRINQNLLSARMLAALLGGN
jgi:beta-lactamase superfamily II metal-dependent hydrolase